MQNNSISFKVSYNNLFVLNNSYLNYKFIIKKIFIKIFEKYGYYNNIFPLNLIIEQNKNCSINKYVIVFIKNKQ